MELEIVPVRGIVKYAETHEDRTERGDDGVPALAGESPLFEDAGRLKDDTDGAEDGHPRRP